MHRDLLTILRCPYCGGRLELVTSLFHRATTDTIADGVLGCECCVFPVVDGIPVLHLHPASVRAREHVERGHPELALRAMVGVDEGPQAEAFEAAARSPESTYREIVDSLGPGFEGGYFLYRFSDPTFVVADAVVRAVAGTVLRQGGRAAGACRPVLPQDLAGPPLHGPVRDSGLLRRKLRPSLRARRLRLRDVCRRVHVHLDQTTVRRGNGPAD